MCGAGLRAVLCVALLLGACAAPIAGSGTRAVDRREHQGFRSVEVSGGIRATLTAGRPYSVTLRGDDNLVVRIATVVRDGRLIVRPRRPGGFRGDLTVEIELPAVDRIAVEDGADVVVTGIDGPALYAECRDGCALSAAGATGELTLNASDGARVDARELTAGRVFVDARDGALGTLTARDAALGSASGGAVLTVWGRPAVRAIDARDGATVSYP